MPALAITLPQFRSAPDATLEALEDGRRLGYAGGFVFDHLWPLGQPQRPALECWTLLAGLAGRLSAIEPGGAGAFRLGTLVTRAGLRPPALLAHMARTVTSVAGPPPPGTPGAWTPTSWPSAWGRCAAPPRTPAVTPGPSTAPGAARSWSPTTRDRHGTCWSDG